MHTIGKMEPKLLCLVTRVLHHSSIFTTFKGKKYFFPKEKKDLFFFREVPTCVNDDFKKIEEHLVFRHKNSTKMNYPYNITVGDEIKEYVGKVGETLDFVCKADKKVFQTEDPDLLDSVLTVVCKTDRYYTVPSSGVNRR